MFVEVVFMWLIFEIVCNKYVLFFIVCVIGLIWLSEDVNVINL